MRSRLRALSGSLLAETASIVKNGFVLPYRKAAAKRLPLCKQRESVLSRNNGGTRILQNQGEQQTQEDSPETGDHPQAAAAEQLLGNKKPDQRKDGDDKNENGCDYLHNSPSLAGKYQIEHNRKRVACHDLGH